MSILSNLSRIAAEYSEARARYLTERSISALPVELQKDIGWPDAYETGRAAASPPAPGWEGNSVGIAINACRTGTPTSGRLA